MSNKFRIYCITDNTWETLWTNDTVSTGITECPLNVIHTVNLNSVSQVKTINKTFHINVNTIIKKNILSINNYTDFSIFLFEGSNTTGKFIHAKFISYMNQHGRGKKGDSNFDYIIRIYDKTNRNVICSQTISGDPLEQTYITTTGTNIPTGESIFSIQVLLGSKGGDIKINYVELVFKI